MKKLGINQIREEFLRFFESKGHMRLKSFSLVPQDDHSLLLINSGMAPMKKWFLREDTPPNVRVTTCQKCIRTPDIERVGKTARHGTFFEMLGNFSFGEYFKEEATKWAWEFITQKLEIPKEKLWISIYEKDDEAFEIWTKHRGVDPSRVVRLGKEDNFWEIGSGPCGPCSEIYYDRGEDKGCQKEDCGVGCDCDRYVEIWNLVFSQYNSDGNGHYTPMEHPNIDTGMGLERLGCILQGVDSLFEVDTVQAIIKEIGAMAGVPYGSSPSSDTSIRVIADHIRSAVFLISDGVVPGNEGREYVLRRLIRRAERNGRQIGIRESFLYRLADIVIRENASAYPELKEHTAYIKKILRAEEESFGKVLKNGMQMLSNIIDQIDSSMDQKRMITGEQAFMLCDTYGFPFDLIREMAAEQHVRIDEETFRQLLDRQKKRAQKASKSNTKGWEKHALRIESPKTEFIGYTQEQCEAKLSELFLEDKSVSSASQGQTVELLFDQTPFYAQSGGQVADTGVWITPQAEVRIEDCQKTEDGHFLHQGTVLKGNITVGTTGFLSIDSVRRHAIMRNHTGAHLLQQALRDVLGDHVHQAGQLVDDQKIRFDFNHFSPMSKQEIAETESIVNDKILAGLPVEISEKSREEARKIGAIALFNEKYGERVRVVNAGGYAIELCGGCHVDNTAKLGLFKIVAESSASAGIRRIEAITGTGVLSMLEKQTSLLNALQQTTKTAHMQELPEKIEALQNAHRENEKIIHQMQRQLTMQKSGDQLSAPSYEIEGVQIFCADCKQADVKTLRELADRFKDDSEKKVALLASSQDQKGNLVAAVSKGAIDMGLHAGKIVSKAAELAGGKGGGRPDSAVAGIHEISQIPNIFKSLPDIIRSFLS